MASINFKRKADELLSGELLTKEEADAIENHLKPKSMSIQVLVENSISEFKEYLESRGLSESITEYEELLELEERYDIFEGLTPPKKSKHPIINSYNKMIEAFKAKDYESELWKRLYLSKIGQSEVDIDDDETKETNDEQTTDEETEEETKKPNPNETPEEEAERLKLPGRHKVK